jgi:hypothetical protein
LIAALLHCVLLLLADPPAVLPGCQCESIKKTNGWCHQCSIGYIAGVEIKSYGLVEALDTHGHAVDPAGLECEACRAAAASNSICKRCGWGIAGNKIYGSRLTYYLALGEARDLGAVTCAACRGHARSTGWCQSCQIGWVGHFAFRERAKWEPAAKEYSLLLLAVDTLKRCEDCALARYYGSYCPKCNQWYKDGQPAEAPRPVKKTPPDTESP